MLSNLHRQKKGKSIHNELSKLKKKSQEKDNQDKQVYQSTFTKDLKIQYDAIVPQILSTISGETNLVTIQATVVAVLHSELNSIKNNQVTRTVIYNIQSNGDFLLGPFQGKVATQRIKKGTGILSKVVQKRDCVITDPKELSGSDHSPKSEIAAPIFVKGKPTAVIYIDSISLSSVFNEYDREVLLKVVKQLQACPWPQLVSDQLLQSRASLYRFFWILLPTSVILSWLFGRSLFFKHLTD